MGKLSDLAHSFRRRFIKTKVSDDDLTYYYMYLCARPVLFRKLFPDSYNPLTGCCSEEEEKDLEPLLMVYRRFFIGKDE